VFAPGGVLARMLPAFEPRPGQRSMATAVAGVIADGGVLLAEAGTGTGKTLAYLVPAILSGKRVLVSTGTKNLQEQIFTKDVPLLRRALGRHFAATYMKGRGNYLCLHRFEQFRQATPSQPAERIALTLIEEWLKRTDTGDRAEVDELPDDLPFWNDISATTENCLGSECPQFGDCFITKMRQRAAESDVVIVNHHLLCADASVRHHSFGEVIPECHVLVVDEAHQLEEVATQYFGMAVSNYRTEELISDADRALRMQLVLDRAQAHAISIAIEHVRQTARAFFDDLRWKRQGDGDFEGDREFTSRERAQSQARAQAQRELLPNANPGSGSGSGSGPGPGPGLFDERVRLTAEALDAVGPSGLALIEALDGLDGAIRLLKEANEDLQAMGKRVADARDQLRFLLRVDDPAFVYFLEIRGRGVFLRASPIDVSSLLRELVIQRMHATVFTSATLAVNGSFGYVRSRLGVTRAEEVRLPSEFDYRTQSLLYLPRRMPEPRDPLFTSRVGDEVIEILRRTEGRAFVLFTSHAALRTIDARVAAALPYPRFVQGTAPRGVLLDRFRRTSNAVLLATSSFWQGVDVVGEALSCVIIDKLPFASPADPITAARIDAINARGGDAFGTYQLPVAILTLLQGIGRLLRHRTDRGVLAILDPRLQTMGYGRRFLAALPPAPITRKLEDIERFFAPKR
jgi:ATP-dependent DNA helicase DinG